MAIFTSSKRSTCNVERGLYVLRYGSCAPGESPTASIAVQRGDIDLVPAPGRSADTLTGPGQSIAVIARTAGALDIVLTARSAALMPETSIDLDLIDHGVGEARDFQSRPVASSVRPTRLMKSKFAITAHVSRIGDVTVADDQWVAGPEMPLPVEGLSIVQADLGIAITYQVMSARMQGRWSGIFQEGEFAGSRQQADPLTGIKLELTGPAAADFAIIASAMFLGSTPVERTGRSVTLESRDPLVGLRIRLNHVNRSAVQTSDDTKNPIRVFRAQR